MARRTTAIQPFDDIINGLAFSPSTEQGRGFMAPIMRTAGHILNLVISVGEDTWDISEDDIRQDIVDTKAHWDTIDTGDIHFSTAANEYRDGITNSFAALEAQFMEWTPEERINRLRNLANRITQYGAMLDREVLGIRNSDAGSSL